ncbi:tyrosine-protein phosphatase [Bacteroidales bacterium OttesenSCG-928-B11]|nr:tyrosine-protein phosphatase [Bacteroidales bacterium OttesenSCG-928-E04]MDL2309411.1 tyrosine-protein phosphatase [Bacteroidales bacterium OttesenSCG-928-C03]MDL2312342.1 tyrosine-protein phosphatase [Bacteroidales bacterium OttesenSCG-928-B11]MDL2326288.1 tyrosine-protein phosphatase [Bacteroidales bacterium OttesenSCG-928-A14]
MGNSESKSEKLTSTHLPMAGGYNFRDLGGMKNRAGQRIKPGMMIRSDDLCNLTDEDLNYLADIPLISIVDFRSDQEAKAAPDKLPESVIHYFPLNIDPGNLAGIVEQGEDMADAEEMMNMLYKLLVTDPICVGRYKEFFALLHDETNIPLLYHCSAGKDRTGIATALFLYSLDFDLETIVEDYLISNVYLAGKYKKYIDAMPQLQPLFETKPQYLQHAFNEIKLRHGTVERFLKETLCVDFCKLRKIYLQ